MCVLGIGGGRGLHSNKQCSGHQLGVLYFSSSDTIYWDIASDSTDSGLSPTRLPLTPHQTLSQFQGVTCISDYRSEVPLSPSLGLINFIRCLTKLRKPVNSQDYQSIINEHNSGIGRCKRCTGQGIRKGLRASTLCGSTALPQFPQGHQSRSSLNPVLLGFTEASFHRHS